MTRADRLHDLLKILKDKEQEALLKVWKDIFEVSNIIEVYERLVYVKKEIDLFELDIKTLNLERNPQFQDIIKSLNYIINFPSINANLQNQAFMKNENINILFASFDMFRSFSEAQHIELIVEDDIPTDEFDEFKNMLRQTIEDLHNSDLASSERVIFLSIFNDIEKALSLYQINGINAFMDAIFIHPNTTIII